MKTEEIESIIRKKYDKPSIFDYIKNILFKDHSIENNELIIKPQTYDFLQEYMNKIIIEIKNSRIKGYDNCISEYIDNLIFDIFIEDIVCNTTASQKENKVIREYDSNDNCIYYERVGEYSFNKNYDSNNNLIHYIDNKGYEYTQEYDENNNLIYCIDSIGYEITKTYDSNNNCIQIKDNKGLEKIWTYDSKNKCIDYEEYYKDNSEINYNSNDNNVRTNRNKSDFVISYSEGLYRYCKSGNHILTDNIIDKIELKESIL